MGLHVDAGINTHHKTVSLTFRTALRQHLVMPGEPKNQLVLTSRERVPMITTREARLAADAWMREEAGRHPELVGAILAGSARTRAPEEPHPPSSDVDLFIYVDAEVPSEMLRHSVMPSLQY